MFVAARKLALSQSTVDFDPLTLIRTLSTADVNI